MSEIKFVELTCQRCGGALEESSHGLYICAGCGKEWREATLYNFTDMLEACDEALRRQRIADISNLRQRLWAQTHREFISNIEVEKTCNNILNYLPDDFYAKFYLATCSKNKNELGDFLFTVDVKERYDDIPLILDYLLKALKPEWIMGVSNFIEKIKDVDTSLYYNYRTQFEKEYGKIDDGVFDPDIPRDVFIAYSSKDMPKVRELLYVLEGENLTCFIAERNMRHGSGSVDNYDELLHTAINNCSVIVFVSSDNSRSTACDAYRKELKYINENRGDMPRVEYLIQNYSGRAAERIFKKFFDGHEYCLSAEDVAVRVTEILLDGESEPKTEHTPVHMPELTPEPEQVTEKKPESVSEPEPEPVTEKKPEPVSEPEHEHTPVHMPELTPEPEQVTEKKPEPEPEHTPVHMPELTPELKQVTEKKPEPVSEPVHEHTPVHMPELTPEPESVTEKKPEPVSGSYKAEPVGRYTFHESILKNGGIATKSDAARLALVFVLMFIVDALYVEFAIYSGMFDPLTGSRLLDVVILIVLGIIVLCGGCAMFLKLCRNYKAVIQSIIIAVALTLAVVCSIVFYNCIKSVEKDGMKFISYDGGYMLTEYTGTAAELEIPETVRGVAVKSIDNSAFIDCTALVSVTIPDNVETIYAYAFYGCTSLESVTIGSGVTEIGSSAFYNCTSLTDITIPENVTGIYRWAFKNCTSLESVTFENAGGWYVAESSTATSGTEVSVTDSETAAGYLTSTYNNYFWKRG